eukprot:3789648-Rhodomonas_salina.1
MSKPNRGTRDAVEPVIWCRLDDVLNVHEAECSLIQDRPSTTYRKLDGMLSIKMASMTPLRSGWALRSRKSIRLYWTLRLNISITLPHQEQQ